MTEVLVVGVDGAGFNLLDDWLKEERLPNLSSLGQRGCSTRLRSSRPPVTCPAWRCYSTGVNPGKHGVFWWEQVHRDDDSFSVPTAEDFHAPDVWNYLEEEGLSSAVVNIPTTYPPEEFDGWMVSGGGGVDGSQYTHPPDLQGELEAKFDYRVFIEGTSSNIGDDPKRVEKVLDVIDARFDAAEHIRDEYDPAFLSLTIFYTNVFHHFFWDDEVTFRVWKKVDERLGEFIDPVDNVLVISDHGSNPIEHEFNVNAWLERNGYLVTETTVSDRFHKMGVTRDRITKLVDVMGAKNFLKRYLPRSLVDRFPSEDGSISGQGKADKINWSESTAMASGQGPVYVLEEDPKERRQIADGLREQLSKVSTPSGRPVARQVLMAEDAYEGPFVDEGPDLFIDQADNIEISGALGVDSIFRSPEGWVAENHRDGVLFAAGPDVDSDPGLPDPASIYDIAPTVLHWFGLAVPEHLDGRVLEELFAPDAEPFSRPVETTDERSVEEPTNESARDDTKQSEMRDRLQDLGYLE